MEDSNYQWSMLLRKYRRKEINEEELKELNRLINTYPIRMQQFKQWTDRQEFCKQLQYYRNINTEESWKRLITAHPSVITPTPYTKKATIYKLLKYAAVGIGIFATISLFKNVIFTNEDPYNPVVKPYNYVQQVSGAEYQLGTGSADAIFASQRPELDYQDTILKVTAAKNLKSKNNTLYDLVTAPRKQMKVQLPDGSKVKLYAASAIRFPLAFKTKKREVEMSGQAFFEVATNKDVPFKVHLTNGVDVEAKGTSFNISTYDNNRIVMSLISGTVTMFYKNEKIDVQAGEQIEFTKEKKFRRIKNANYLQAIAWTNNVFDFVNKDVKDVIMEIGRYYHYQVIFKDSLPPMRSGGTFNMDEDLENILAAIEAVNKIQIKPEGNTLMVSRAAQKNQIR